MLPSVLQRGSTASVMGYALELLTVADLNTRCVSAGGFAYLNPAPFTAHDAFVKTSDGWRTIQVKAARTYRSRKGLRLHNRRGITKVKSDIVALVDFDRMLIRYIGVATPLPVELPTGVAGICRFSSSTAEIAEPPQSNYSGTAKSSTVFSASTVVNDSTS